MYKFRANCKTPRPSKIALLSHFVDPPPSPTRLEYVLGGGSRGRGGPDKLTQNHRFFWRVEFCNWLFLFLLLLTSCGMRTSPNVAELSPTKQKQKIVLLQKKLQLAEKEQKKLTVQIERLSDEMREAELAYIRKQIDEYEDLIRKTPSKKADFESADLFLNEREQLHKMIQGNESAYEAQVVLDRILQLITELSDQVE